MEIIATPTCFKFKFKYDPEIVRLIKLAFPNCNKFNPKDKTFEVPTAYRIQVDKFSHQYGFKWGIPITETTKKIQSFDIEPLPNLNIDIPLKLKLRHYQESGIAYNLIHKRVIMADDMGLGKTIQAIATIIGFDILYKNSGYEPSFPCLIICPSSVKYNWMEKIIEYTGKKDVQLLTDYNKGNYHLHYEAGLCNWFIVNYESLGKFFVKSTGATIGPDGKKVLKLENFQFDARVNLFKSIVIDEGHRIRDPKTLQTKIVRGISENKNYRFILTGTPIVNKTDDLSSQLSVLGILQKFGGYTYFKERWCSKYTDKKDLIELNYHLNKNCFFRRSKQEVATELPAKSRQIVLCDISNRREYEHAEASLISYLKQYKDASDDKIKSAVRGQVMVQIGILKDISAKGKLKDVKEYLDDILQSGEKVGVFVHLKEVANIVKQHYPNCASITGDDDLINRQNSIHRFKHDPKCKLIVLSIKAAGTGIDGLQFASSLATFIELPWTAADCDQAEDRFNRIGQANPVNCIYFLGRDTIDEHIYKIIETKRDIANTITGNTDEVKVDFVNEFANLFNKK